MTDRKRPWHGPELRLGIKMFQRHPEMGLGWALLRMRPHMLDDGEAAVPQADIPTSMDLTGAEYRTLREDCGLSILEAAEFHDVREGTIKAWEKASPPSGAAGELLGLRARIEASARKALDVYLAALAKRPEIGGVDLYRYEGWSYPDSAPAAEGLPHGAHNRLVSKTADLLAANQVSVTIEYWGLTAKQGPTES